MPVFLAFAIFLTACSSSADQEVRDTAQRFADAAARQDNAAACALLSPQALADVTDQGKRSCPEAFQLTVTGQTAEVTVWGEEARAGDSLFLHEFPDGWRVTGAGCRPQDEDRPYECEVGGP